MTGWPTLLLFAAAPTVGPVPPADDPAAACADRGDEIVVCARRRDPEANRLPRLPDRYEPREGMPPAEFRVFGDATAGVAGEQRSIAPGVSAPAIMLHLKIPLGGGRR